jgi:hypothetical protein
VSRIRSSRRRHHNFVPPKEKTLRKVKTLGVIGEERGHEKAEFGTDEEAVKRKPTVRYELTDESVNEMAHESARFAELRGCDPEPRKLDGEGVTLLRCDSS